jgi:hypothetical protein
MKMEGVVTLDGSRTSTPDEHQPHAFEPGPDVPIVNATAEDTGLPHGSGPKCALCGAPQDDQIHTKGEAKADAESPRWGL